MVISLMDNLICLKISIKSMAICFFCNENCADEEHDEYQVGYNIGEKIICMGCLQELKEALAV